MLNDDISGNQQEQRIDHPISNYFVAACLKKLFMYLVRATSVLLVSKISEFACSITEIARSS
ncbi:hypothetical protein, partial [Klebsiella pneumoniae]|uniref:hypothetical protein n=1 Tax=Klebsiella pneumoniae TaxID=573 RepID=UPI0039C3738E